MNTNYNPVQTVISSTYTTSRGKDRPQRRGVGIDKDRSHLTARSRRESRASSDVPFGGILKESEGQQDSGTHGDVPLKQKGKSSSLGVLQILFHIRQRRQGFHGNLCQSGHKHIDK